MRQNFKQFCDSIKYCDCCEYTSIRKASECEKLFNKEHSNKPKEASNELVKEIIKTYNKFCDEQNSCKGCKYEYIDGLREHCLTAFIIDYIQNMS